jgi:hypothetical protein
VPVGSSSANSSSSSLALLLGAALVLSLLVAALAAVRASVLPRQADVFVHEHREAVMFGGAATAVSIALGLMIALLGS